MAKVSPFCAWRPPIDKAHLVASRSFITYSQQDLIDKLKGNPFTFLHIINPEYEYQKKISSYQEKVVAIRKKYEEFIQKEYFIHDDKPALYIYRQIKNGNTYTGIIALTSIWDYFNGKIKKHEATLTKKEEKLKEYLKITKINASDSLGTCQPNHKDIVHLIKVSRSFKICKEHVSTFGDFITLGVWGLGGGEIFPRK